MNMNLLNINITDNDLKLMLRYIKAEEIEKELIDDLEDKLEYCVKKIELRDEFMSKSEEVDKEYIETHKEDKEEAK